VLTSLLFQLILIGASVGGAGLLAQRIPEVHLAARVAAIYFLLLAVSGLVFLWLPASLTLSAQVIFLAIAGLGIITLFLQYQAGFRLLITPKSRNSSLQGVVALGLVLLIILHITLVMANTLTRDLFTWDAFTTWIYRTKSWVLAGAILPEVEVKAWLTEPSASTLGVYATHYPKLLSSISALSATLAVNAERPWYAPAAAMPWPFMLTMLVLLQFGLLRSAQLGRFGAICGALALCSLPLLNIHGALFGYGDLTLAAFSGGGLALLLLYRQTASKGYLGLGLLLLSVGTQIKLEGSLWLALGLMFLSITWLWQQRFGKQTLVAGIALVTICAGLRLTLIDLGPFGLWGFDQNRLFAGFLGDYGIRPYNALPNYFDQVVISRNFHIAFTVWPISLLSLWLFRRQWAKYHLLMTALFISGQAVIFGVSEFSSFAETGTALSRVLLQFLPVVILSSCLGLQCLVSAAHTSEPQISNIQEFAPNQGKHTQWLAVKSLLVAGVVLTCSTLFMLGVNQTKTSYSVADADVLGGRGSVTRQQMTVEDISGPMAVIRFQPKELKPADFVEVSFEGDHPEQVSFFWIKSGLSGQVTSIPLPREGSSFIDMREQASWRHATGFKELGFIVPQKAATNARFGEINVWEKTGLWSLPSLLEDWSKSEFIKQVSINRVEADTEAAASFNSIASLAALICLLGALVAPKIRHLEKWSSAMLGAVLVLWLVADGLWLNRFLGATQTALNNSYDPTIRDDYAWHLKPMADAIASELHGDNTLLVIPSSKLFNFDAQKLPYEMLPIRSAFVGPHLRNIPKDWQGPVVLVGEGDELDQKAARIEKRLKRPVSVRGENFALFAAADRSATMIPAK